MMYFLAGVVVGIITTICSLHLLGRYFDRRDAIAEAAKNVDNS